MSTNWTPVSRDPAGNSSTPSKAQKPVDLRETFVSREPRRTMEDLIVPLETRTQIDVLLSRILHQYTLYHEWNLGLIDPLGERTAINLYGPPGTGKTHCAEAIAHVLGKPILDVNYAELESKYVGETAKNIVMAFQKAEEDGAVLFFDEADSILGKRLTDVRASADYGVNQSRSVMLKQLENFQGVVVFATNMAKNYDGAFVRRILGHVEFKMPDEISRRRLWQLFLVDGLPLAPDVMPENLAEISEGLSGGEMKNVLIAAASAAVRREGHQRRIELSDFERQADVVKRARTEIGNFDYEPPKVTETTIPLSELPRDVRRVAKHELLEGRSGRSNVRWAHMPAEFLPWGLRILEAVAGADGVRTAEETNAIQVVLAYLPPDVGPDAVAKAKKLNSGDDLPEGLIGSDWARLIVRDAVALGFSDGEFNDDERRVVERWAARLALPGRFLKGCESWAVRGLHWSVQGADLLDAGRS